jgi:hypothetical protein
MFLTLLAPGALAPVGTVPYIKVGGVWLTATSYIKVGGAWVTNSPYVKVSGTWL